VHPDAVRASAGTIPPATPEQLWSRLQRFLDEILPVAEKAGVRLALHPDDPPMPTIRGQPRLVYQPRHYQTVIERNPSPANQLEFCIGSLAEMTEGNVYEAVEQYASQGRIAYVHLRNVRGKVPHYRETFIDDGDVDVFRVLTILGKCGFDYTRPRATDELRRALARRHGVRHGLPQGGSEMAYNLNLNC
jgi:mannonate dehydratase